MTCIFRGDHPSVWPSSTQLAAAFAGVCGGTQRTIVVQHHRLIWYECSQSVRASGCSHQIRRCVESRQGRDFKSGSARPDVRLRRPKTQLQKVVPGSTSAGGQVCVKIRHRLHRQLLQLDRKGGKGIGNAAFLSQRWI